MKFETLSTIKERYKSLNEMRNDYRREDIVENYTPVFNDIKQEMFDRWDVENIYLYGDILDKDRFIVEDINLFVEIGRKEFDNMVDSFYIQEINNINFTFLVNKQIYKYKDNIWINEGDVPVHKLKL